MKVTKHFSWTAGTLDYKYIFLIFKYNLDILTIVICGIEESQTQKGKVLDNVEEARYTSQPKDVTVQHFPEVLDVHPHNKEPGWCVQCYEQLPDFSLRTLVANGC
jgi:hypothetical protein